MQKDLLQHIRSIKNGDQKAFKWLVENYQQAAFALAFRICCNEEDARDIVQDSFIKIWKKMESFNEQSSFTSWMFKIVANSAIDKLRQQKRNTLISIDLFPEHILSADYHNWKNKIEIIELGILINLLADGLPEKQRLIFVLRDIQGLSSEETGEILDLSDSVIKSNLYHARAAIRNKLSEHQKKERSTYEV